MADDEANTASDIQYSSTIKMLFTQWVLETKLCIKVTFTRLHITNPLTTTNPLE